MEGKEVEKREKMNGRRTRREQTEGTAAESDREERSRYHGYEDAEEEWRDSHEEVTYIENEHDIERRHAAAAAAAEADVFTGRGGGELELGVAGSALGNSSLTQTFKLVSAGKVQKLSWRTSYRVCVKRKRNVVVNALRSGLGRCRSFISGDNDDDDDDDVAGLASRNEDRFKQILDDVVGEVYKGELLAIMGPSGSGKTSLLNVLAGRVPKGGDIVGEVLVDGMKRKEWKAGGKAARTGAASGGIGGHETLGNGEKTEHHRTFGMLSQSQHRFSHVTAYVQQDDILFPTLTVEETFMYAAQLRLPRNMTTEMKNKIKEAIINELGLRKTLRTLVGGGDQSALGILKGGRGVSGGERKRVNIGVEMIRLPSILFLDEPTSGLDSFQAQNIIETLISLSRHGRIVISTIHQPRSSIYEMFDKLLLLDDSGREVYCGRAHKALTYFSDAGCECPQHYNPADFFLDAIATDYRTEANEAASRKRIEALVKHFRSTNQLYLRSSDGVGDGEENEDDDTETVNNQAARPALPHEHENGGDVPDEDQDSANYSNDNALTGADDVHTSDGDTLATADDDGGDDGDDDGDDDDDHNDDSANAVDGGRQYLYGASWPKQVWLLYRRQLKVTLRTKAPLLVNVAQGIFFAVLVGLLYNNMGDDYRSVSDRTGLLFFSLINVSLGGVFMSLSTFPKEKPIINCERNAKAYQVSAYYLAKYLSDLPLRIAVGLIYSSIVYWIAGLNPGFSNYVMFMVILVLIRLGGESIGTFTGALMPSLELAQAVVPILVILFLLFGGFYINQESMPAGAKWVKYTSMFYWGFTALSRNEFTGEVFTCDELYPGCKFTGEQQLDILGFDQYTIAEAVAALILIQVVFHFLAYVSLRATKARYMSM